MTGQKGSNLYPCSLVRHFGPTATLRRSVFVVGFCALRLLCGSIRISLTFQDALFLLLDLRWLDWHEQAIEFGLRGVADGDDFENRFAGWKHHPRF